MTSVEVLPLIALVAMFVIATFFPINIGILGFIGAFGVGYFMLGYDDKELLAEFPPVRSRSPSSVSPTSSVWPNATARSTCWSTPASAGVRGRVTVVPWVFFFCASVLTALARSARRQWR